MKPHHAFFNHACIRITSVLALAALSACGGGGDDTAPPPGGGGTLTYPSSGAYGWTLKASGDTTALKHGLSLVHASLPDNEYVVEQASESITDTHLVLRGSINASQLTATAIEPHALVYIYGGDVRSVSMQANGAKPLVKSSGSGTACRFILSANDYADPDNSRFIVSTAGGDGDCTTEGDNGLAEVRLSSGSQLGYTVLSGDLPLDVARNPVSLAPRGWIYPRYVELWGASPPTRITTRATGTKAVTHVVASTYRSALVEEEDGAKLSLLDFSAGATVADTPLDATLTAGTGWTLIGYDSDAFYVYLNELIADEHLAYDSPWKIVKIARSGGTESLLASGTGVIALSSMGSRVLYLTVVGQADNRLVRIEKIGGVISTQAYPIDTKPTVQTSASGIHQLWLVTSVGSAGVGHVINLIDENGATLSSSAGGFPLGVADAAIENFNSSESRTRFIYAEGFGTRGFADASLVSYDTLTQTRTVLGTLPGSAAYGGGVVFASAVGGPGTLGAGFATRSSGGVYVEQDAKVFSYDLATANSLKFTKNK